jgi:DNA-binding response OmpR family regulator
VSAQIPVTNRVARSVTKVLHIEDDASVARSMARVLRLRGFEVASAATHDEVLRYLEVDGFRPNLILTDLQLGLGLTAETLVAEIAARLDFKPPIIILTGTAGQDVENARSFADRILAKPVDIHVLLREIDALLGARDCTDRQD